METLLGLAVRWEESDSEQLTNIRRSLLKLGNDDLKTIMSRLRRPEICASETYQRLIRTPKMFERLLALGFMKKPVSEEEKRKEEFARLAYDRAVLYEQVWSKPVQEVAKSFGVSGVRLGKVCRGLQVPVRPRGYWARIRSGGRVRKPALPKVDQTAAQRMTNR